MALSQNTKKYLSQSIRGLETLRYVVELPSNERSLAYRLDKQRINVAHRLITNVLRHNGYCYNFETQRLSKLSPSDQERKTLPEPNLSFQDEDE